MASDLLRSPPPRLVPLIEAFIDEYMDVGLRHGYTQQDLAERLSCLMERADWLLDNPEPFVPIHQAVRKPFDYLTFGLSFFKPLVDWKHSIRLGDWKDVNRSRLAGENTILLANHQTEADPQLMHLLLQDDLEELASSMRFMAGERVQKDPIAAPFCLGRDLVCIYSRRHLDHPPERKAEKLIHNATAMRQLRDLLTQGGVTLYLAPSGGRDRQDSTGAVQVASFDPDAIEMMRLMAAGCGRPTICRPLALATYSVLPPPNDIHRPLGEVRHTLGGAIGMSLGSPIDWSSLPSGKEYREKRAQDIHRQTIELYRDLSKQLD